MAATSRRQHVIPDRYLFEVARRDEALVDALESAADEDDA